MIIIDSLLKINFFSLERTRRTSLFFATSKVDPRPTLVFAEKFRVRIAQERQLTT
jgi:hypothetical protein